MKREHHKETSPREVELKVHLPPGSRTELERSSSFSGAQPKQTHLVTTYFDTKDGFLNKAGLTLRVRRIEDVRIQTVKSRPTALGVASDRSEWEWPIDQDEPDVGCLDGIGKLAEVAHVVAGRLRPVFVTDIRRTTRLLHLEGDTVVEASLDEGSIEAGTAREPVSELELELKGGRVGPIYQLAADLHALAPFWLSPESKAARGWRLQSGQTDGVRKARLPKLGRHIRAADGLQHMIGAALGSLMANIVPTLLGDAEALHQIRVALRGARAALQLFRPHLAAAASERFDAELRRFGQVFGTARDWDVFLLETLPAASPALASDQLQALRQAAERERQTAAAAVKEAIHGHDFTALVLALAGWLEAGAVEPATLGDGRMHKALWALVPELLDRVARQTRKRARHAGRLSAEDRHLLRKSLKRLSYGVAHLAEPYGSRSVKAYRARCAKLQRMLGSANDAVVTRRLAVRLAADDDPAVAEAARALAIWSDCQSRKALKGLDRRATKLCNTPDFWA